MSSERESQGQQLSGVRPSAEESAASMVERIQHDIVAQGHERVHDLDDSLDAWGNENALPEVNGIAHDVLHALVEARTGVAVDLFVLDDGVLLIRGEAPSDEVRRRIVEVAKSVRGVEHVVNEIGVARTTSP